MINMINICVYLNYFFFVEMALEIITGPMFSGKTTELIRRVASLKKDSAMRLLVINHDFDTRCHEKQLRTHDGIVYPALKTSEIMLVDIRSYDVIAIDEAQFFSNLETFVHMAIQKYGKWVIVAGLNGDYRQRPFGELHKLLPMANKIDLRSACCYRCCGHASFTKRITESTQTVVVGGADKYVAACRDCL